MTPSKSDRGAEVAGRDTGAAVLAERLTAQLLAGEPAADPVGVAKRLLAIQAQDLRAARLAIRARTTGGRSADIDRALTEERTLVVEWLNRGTLHMVRREDYAWLHALTTPPLLTANARRLQQEGVLPQAAERAVAVVEHSLAGEGPLTRPELRDRIAAAGVRTEGQALVHILALACLRGIAMRGPIIGRHHAYALVRDWLGPADPPERDKSLAELARRYLAGHGPATDRDLARWAGLPLRDARAGLQAIGALLDERPDGLVDLAGREPAAAPPPPRLLGGFEPVLLGWRSREEILGPNEPLVITGGLFRPFALVRGRGVATWKIRDGRIELEPFGRLARRDAAALEADGEAVLRYVGDDAAT
jgi:hypothetical protein